MNLYELKESYLKVLELIEAGEEGLEDTLESINDTIEAKADGYAKVIRNLEGNITALKAEIDRMTDRKKSIENNIERLKENLKNAMIETGKEKIKTDLFNIKVADNPYAVNVIDETLIPEEYFKVEITRKLDKVTLKDDMKNGQIIKGAELTRGKGLRIK
jgi:cell division protein FtsB